MEPKKLIECLKYCADNEDCKRCLRWSHICDRHCVDDLMVTAAEALEELVDDIPVVHGKWLDVFTGFNFFAATCSACHKRSDLPPIAVAKYCPRCGARMDGDYV